MGNSHHTQLDGFILDCEFLVCAQLFGAWFGQRWAVQSNLYFVTNIIFNSSELKFYAS